MKGTSAIFESRKQWEGFAKGQVGLSRSFTLLGNSDPVTAAKRYLWQLGLGAMVVIFILIYFLRSRKRRVS